MDRETTASSFFWDRTREVLADLARRYELRLDEGRKSFACAHVSVTPPLVFPIGPDVGDVRTYLEALPDAPLRHFVLLMQAGAVAMGVFDQGESLATKSTKKYVVRGRGRAQPTHLKTRGKSRYGSRLRLQNARKLLIETNERLAQWTDLHGASSSVFYNAPIRLWADLFATKPPPPFDKDERLVRIPWDLPVPTTAVLLRTYRRMSFGAVNPC